MSQTTIVSILSILQILIALGLVNVWIFRSGRATKYRGAGAQNMKQEFIVYGLPVWAMYVVGFLKMMIVVVMVSVLFAPYLMVPFGITAFALLVVLMIGAIAMHIKVKDTLMKIFPAICMLFMSALALYLTLSI